MPNDASLPLTTPTSIFDRAADDPAKLILIGETGAGKTGSTAALIAAGYHLRYLNTDNGFKIVRALLTDDKHYGYARYMREHNIDFRSNVSVIDIPIEMGLRTVEVREGSRTKRETLLAPKNAKAWDKIVTSLENWTDPLSGEILGHFAEWTARDVLVLDSFTTIARQAYYFAQALNGRLGAMEEGFTHQRDVGGAQSYLRRLLEMLYSPAVKCNVVLVCHVNRIDDSRGVTRTPEAALQADPSAIINVKGFPMAVGVALSKRVGTFFNDSFIVEQTGSGTATRRRIYTVPTTIDGVTISAKNSVWLEREYDVSTGLAEIFAALRGQEPPTELVRALGGRDAGAKPPAASARLATDALPAR